MDSGRLSITTPFTFHVVAGTLKAGSSLLAQMINFGAQPTTVDAGATFDLGGFGLSLTNLLGGGAVTDSGAAATLTLAAANFSGAISGPLSLVANGAVVLTGANTYTGTTTINSGDSVQAGVGGATGSIGGGAVSDAGALSIDRNNAVTLANAISGAGVLKQIGTGVTSINTANTYTGGTTDFGRNARHRQRRCAWNRDGVNDRRRTHRDGDRELSRTRSVFREATTIAAADGTTLTVNPSFTTINANSTLNFGAPGQDGVVIWHAPAFTISTPFTFNVVAGTLKAVDGTLSQMISFWRPADHGPRWRNPRPGGLQPQCQQSSRRGRAHQ